MSELINMIHKNPVFKIKAFLIQSLADNSMTMWCARRVLLFRKQKTNLQILLTPSGELRHLRMRFSIYSDPELQNNTLPTLRFTKETTVKCLNLLIHGNKPTVLVKVKRRHNQWHRTFFIINCALGNFKLSYTKEGKQGGCVREHGAGRDNWTLERVINRRRGKTA